MNRSGLILFLLFLFTSFGTVDSQEENIIECGSVIESELTLTNPVHTYYIELAPGDRLTFKTESIGDTFDVEIGIYDPGGGFVDAFYNMKHLTVETTDTLSSRGLHKIVLSREVGVYTLYVSCTLRDGTFIDATTGQTTAGAASSASLPPPAFGFPGLAPVDFAGITAKPITEGFGAITPTGGEVAAFTLDASTGGLNLDLTLTRLSGNLNLGLAVLSSDNQVVFFTTLVTSQTLNTRFTLPAAGTYTIGVFRVDLLPPAAPEPTAFQVTGTLNP